MNFIYNALFKVTIPHSFKIFVHDQVFSQPLFASVEQYFREKYPNSIFVTGDLKQISALRLNPLSLCFRTAYVAFTTGFSILFPYFNQVIGIAGAINFWPIVVYFPVEMYLAQKHIERWTKRSVFLRVYCFVTLIVILYAFIGSIKGLIAARFSQDGSRFMCSVDWSKNALGASLNLTASQTSHSQHRAWSVYVQYVYL